MLGFVKTIIPIDKAKGASIATFLRRFLLTACFLILASALSVEAATLKDIIQKNTGESTRVILQLNKQVRFSEHFLPATDSLPQRSYVDIYSTSVANQLKQWIKAQADKGNNVRIGIHGTTVRVALDLEDGQYCEIYQDSTSNAIVMEIFDQPSPAAPLQTAQEKPFIVSSPNVTMQQTPPASLVTEVSEEPETKAAPSQLSKFFFWGHLLGFAAGDLDKDTGEDDHFSRIRGRLGLGRDDELKAGHSLQTRVSVEFDKLNYDNDFADEDHEIRLHEAYVALNAPNWDFSIGKQRVRWGKSDQLTPLDSINPDDLRQGFTIDLEERKIPSWLAQLRTYGSFFTLEAIVSPWFEESELEYFDSDWALYRNLRQAILANPELPTSLKTYAANLSVHEKHPAKSLGNVSAAVRLAWKTEQADFALSYRYGWETLPTITSFPIKNINYNGDPNDDIGTILPPTAIFTNESVEARFKRQKITGFEWETVFDPIGFRGEVAYIDKVAFLSSDLTSERREAGHLVTGIDYTSETEWYSNLQVSWYHIFSYNNRILFFERDNVSLLGEISKPVWRGNLEFSLKYNYTLTDGASYVQPSVLFKYFDNTECEIGIMVFSGDSDTLLGSYDNADQIYTRIKISF